MTTGKNCCWIPLPETFPPGCCSSAHNFFLAFLSHVSNMHHFAWLSKYSIIWPYLFHVAKLLCNFLPDSCFGQVRKPLLVKFPLPGPPSWLPSHLLQLWAGFRIHFWIFLLQICHWSWFSQPSVSSFSSPAALSPSCYRNSLLFFVLLGDYLFISSTFEAPIWHLSDNIFISPHQEEPYCIFLCKVLEHILRNAIVSWKVHASSTLPSNSKLFYKVLILTYIDTREVVSETEIMSRKFIMAYSRDQHLWRKRKWSRTGQRDKLNLDVISRKTSAPSTGSPEVKLFQDCPGWG